MNSPQTEAEWIAGLSAEDLPTRRAAVDGIYRAYGAGLLGLCLRIACCRSDAGDALQATFVQVLRYGSGFRGESSLRTWISRIAIRSALAVHARRGRRATDELSEDSRAPGGGPAEQAADNEGAARLLAAVARLPAEQRVVLGLAAFDAMPGVEIAAVLGIPQGPVYSRLHAARSKLRSLLEPAADAAPIRQEPLPLAGPRPV